jgi:hypothetical protein
MTTTKDPIRRALAMALLVFSGAFVAVFLLHFRRPADFFHFKLQYVPLAPERVVASLIRAQNQAPLIHDPHVLAYLTLPLLPPCAYAIHLVARVRRPLLSAGAMTVTVSGTIYLGGIFGMWTAFYRGLGLLQPSQTDGAVATFKALTANQGAFLLTTTLGKLAMIGLALQGLTLLRTIKGWAVACIVGGATLFLLFWDLDNWMLVGTLLLLAGFTQVRTALLD